MARAVSVAPRPRWVWCQLMFCVVCHSLDTMVTAETVVHIHYPIVRSPIAFVITLSLLNAKLGVAITLTG